MLVQAAVNLAKKNNVDSHTKDDHNIVGFFCMAVHIVLFVFCYFIFLLLFV